MSNYIRQEHDSVDFVYFEDNYNNPNHDSVDFNLNKVKAITFEKCIFNEDLKISGFTHLPLQIIDYKTSPTDGYGWNYEP